MPLPLPRLDTRSFDQLVEEGSALLPRLAPGWTDYNLHDPGITLIDLLAWLVEIDIYRLDRTSQAAFRAFLRLVGIYQRSARVAKTVLVFNPRAGVNTAVLLPDKLQVSNQEGSIAFQTSQSLTVSPARLQSVLTGMEAALNDCSAQNGFAGKGFAPFGLDPQPGTACYLGFDAPLATGADEICLYVWSPLPEQDSETVVRLIHEFELEQSALRACGDHDSGKRLDWRKHYSARTQWEYYALNGKWEPLADVSDETQGLTLSGGVRFHLPQHQPAAAGGVPSKPGQYFLRCRLTSGYYECPPHIKAVAINAIQAHHAVSIDTSMENEMICNGRAGQTLQLKQRPVVPGSTGLHVTVNGVEEKWHEAPDWDRARPHERVYVLSAESGQLIFGDGLHGRTPDAGAKIKVMSYKKGGGAAGNVPANTLTHCGNANVDVGQPVASFGGALAENLNEAKGRAIDWLNSPQRAVTLADFEQMAQDLPGVPVQRTHALADYDPALPGLPAPGSLTLVVVPACANPIPEPGPDMLCAIEARLEHRRTLTTELHVISPGFITVAVRAGLHVGPGVDGNALEKAAVASLNAFLDPLHGGVDGLGWPFGRNVYQSEIMALLNALPGVDYVEDVRLEVESQLEIYKDYITWMQVFERVNTSSVLNAQLRSEPGLPASRITAQARLALQAYFKTRRGASLQITRQARCQDVIAVLSCVEGVLRIEQVMLNEGAVSPASCGNVTVCAHDLVLPGRHQVTISGARTTSSTRPGKLEC